ncbi:signal transduction histidine kinase [Cryobacterium sp. CAN_C3]|uniref:sensor histidine kinase n=1 Tax=unclassified Cryobacterium TaxID=2649013 RepID=UPI0018C97DA9|nr:sensor histidine kinase [Cryobacterium sp. CAN_C3]MEC5155184.1 signal transduction histidine kinase [Cryobacterium sp. CAN_C3]
MPPHWDSDAAWYDPDRPRPDAGGRAGSGIPRRARLWLPVVISFLVQVPAVAILAWPGRRGPGFGSGDTGGDMLGGFDGHHRPFEFFGDRPGLALAGWFLAVALALIGPLALVVARRFPGPVTLVIAAAAGALVLVRPDIGVPSIALVFAIVLGIVRGARVWVYSSVGSVWVVTILTASLVSPSLHPMRVAFTTLALAVIMGAGEGLRSRTERFAEVRRTVDARRQSAEQRERVRIARELHDVLAHSLSQINVQAGVGLHLIDSQPEKAAEALASIKSTSKNALDEVRTVLGILRTGADEGQAPLSPEPDLAGLPALIDSFRAQHLTVDFVDALDAPQAAPAATQLALYRICQEALTNVLRHANASKASVYLGPEQGSYLITVTDDGRAPDGPIVPGGGLLGMRERAELNGGSLWVTRGGAGGVRIEARIPFWSSR